MNRVLDRLRLFFCTFSGEDDYIIRKCRLQIQFSFALIGLFVLLIFIGCWVSASSFTSELFEGSGKWVSVPLGVLWALLVANMYLLLLYTVSPAILPVARKKVKKGKKGSVAVESLERRVESEFTASLVFRICFISLLAIIIAQPLNILLLSSFSESSLANYKAEYRINMIIVADSSLIKQEVQSQAEFYQNVMSKIHASDSQVVAGNTRLLNDKVASDQFFLVHSKMLLDSLLKWNKYPFRSKAKCDSVRSILSALVQEELQSDERFVSQIESIRFTNRTLQGDFEAYRASLKATIMAKMKNYMRIDDLLNRSNFYVKRIQILLSENPLSWLITLMICGMFLLPIYWKFSIRNHGGFYEIRRHDENKIVREDYNEFKMMYSKVFEARFREYNRRTWVGIMYHLRLLEEANPSKANEIRERLKEELQIKSIVKFEYWADPPFRTKRKQSNKQLLLENDFLKLVYPDKV